MGRFSLLLTLFDCLLYNGDQKGRKYAEWTNNFRVEKTTMEKRQKKTPKWLFQQQQQTLKTSDLTEIATRGDSATGQRRAGLPASPTSTRYLAVEATSLRVTVPLHGRVRPIGQLLIT